LHARKIEEKTKENEKNIGLNDEKSYEDQFTTFDGLASISSILELSLYSLILFHT